jgi:AMP-binding enzyme
VGERVSAADGPSSIAWFGPVGGDVLDRPLLVDGPATYSYRQALDLGSEIVSRWSVRRSLLFIEGLNTPPSIAAYLAALRGGHVVHLLDPRKVDANAELIDRYRPNGVIRFGEQDQPEIEVPNAASLALHPNLAVLLSTSGSTGSTKFVKLSYANVAANTSSIVEYMGLGPDDRSITLLKPFYSYGYSVLNSHFAAGGSLVLTELSVQDRGFWELAYATGITNISGVPHTFETMQAMSIDWARLPKLRFLTVAGGRLKPSLVRTMAEVGALHNFAFYVMYGQTEGAPRLSYLPPELALTYPDSIGVAVPGGHLGLVDEEGRPVEGVGVEGELVYRGPNVMVGYATEPAELSTSVDIPVLHTGDLARRNEAGLFVITGRTSRFVKLFSSRVSLDEVEAHLNEAQVAAVVGTDQLVTAFVEGVADPRSLSAQLGARYQFPATVFRVMPIPSIPRLANGKIDYQALLARAETLDQAKTEHRFIRRFWKELLDIVLGRMTEVHTVDEAFFLVFPVRKLDDSDSFISLGGDSLSFVQLSIYLEQCLDQVPTDWHEMPIGDLRQQVGRSHVGV